MNLKALILPDVEEFIKEKDFQGLRNLLVNFPPQTIAEVIRELDGTKKALVFRVLPTDLASDVLAELEGEEVRRIIEYMKRDEFIKLVESMDPDDRVALFEELPGDIVKELLREISPEEKRKTELLLNYPEDSCGRIMNPEFISVHENTLCSQALDKLLRYAKEFPEEVLYYIYITDRKGYLLRYTTLIDLIRSPADEPILNISYNALYVKANDSKEQAAQLILKYDLLAIPVVDSLGKLVGVITVDDVLDVIEEEATEDIYKFAGVVDPEDRYFDLGYVEKLKKRLPTIFGMLLLGNFSGIILDHFSSELSKFLVLSFFIPNLMNTTGVMGAQSATFSIRAIATGEFEMHLRQFVDYFRKELITSFMIAILVGLGISIVAYIRAPSYYALALAVSISMMISCIVANMVGFTLPILVRKLGFDPASVSAPLITTLGDVITLSSYFMIAKLLLGI